MKMIFSESRVDANPFNRPKPTIFNVYAWRWTSFLFSLWFEWSTKYKILFSSFIGSDFNWFRIFAWIRSFGSSVLFFSSRLRCVEGKKYPRISLVLHIVCLIIEFILFQRKTHTADEQSLWTYWAVDQSLIQGLFQKLFNKERLRLSSQRFLSNWMNLFISSFEEILFKMMKYHRESEDLQ